ncbi:hypothetical protein BC828DRAFT_182393 [Blastocladiella britannica]|nr:hypothetical protein BC828DRAFT_182393 [Blastocladiella britannica]
MDSSAQHEHGGNFSRGDLFGAQWSPALAPNPRTRLLPCHHSQEDGWLVPGQEKPLTVTILQYGPGLDEAAKYNAFQRDVLTPAVRDRVGAPSETLVPAMVARLKAAFPQYHVTNMAWRVWALELIQPGVHARQTNKKKCFVYLPAQPSVKQNTPDGRHRDRFTIMLGVLGHRFVEVEKRVFLYKSRIQLRRASPTRR